MRGNFALFVTVLCLKTSLGENVTSTTTGATLDQNATEFDSEHEIDFDTLSMFGVTPEFAEQFRLNLIKAIAEASKEGEDQGLRQGEFGGVSGGFYQGGGGAGGGAPGGAPGGGGQEEEEEEEEDDGPMMPTTPGPGAFGVLSGLFGIFSGLGSLNPSRIIQSTVNFFPPGQRMMAQMIVDSLIGYTPPENRTVRPRPRPRRTTTVTPLPAAEMVTASSMTPGVTLLNGTDVNATSTIKDGEAPNKNETTNTAAESEVVEAAPVVTTTTPEPEPEFLNVHEILNRTTVPPPFQNEDDEGDFNKEVTITRNNATLSSYKVKPKAPPEDEVEANNAEMSTVAVQNATVTETVTSTLPTVPEVVTNSSVV